jgi:hypothetical protein
MEATVELSVTENPNLAASNLDLEPELVLSREDELAPVCCGRHETKSSS